MTNARALTIWGREFELPVKYPSTDNVQLIDQLDDSLDELLRNKKLIKKAKAAVEDYCKEKVLEDDENQKKDNIFSYILPQYIFVKEGTKGVKIALVCRYRYDEEHGLMIVFDSDGNYIIGGQDMPF